MTATLRFMDSPATTGAVRLDLNPDRRFYPADLDPGVPSLEGDPDGVGVEYGFRTVSWTQVVRGSKMDALQVQSQLARELLRRENWLLFQVDPTVAPVWFKTYRTEPGSLSLEHVYEDGADVWQIAVTLTADRFAYGERVILSPVTVTNDPTAATNPMGVTLPSIVGDAPAPLRAELTPSVQDVLESGSILLANHALSPSKTFGRAFLHSGDMTPGVDATYTTAVSGAIESDAIITSFSTNTGMVDRASFTANLPRGRYRVFVRTQGVAGSSFGLQVGVYANGAYVYGPTSTLNIDGSWSWSEIGSVSFPHGAAVEDEGFFGDIAGSQLVSIAVSFKSGTANPFRIDEVVLLPATQVGLVDSAAATITSGNPHGANGTKLVVDGDTEAALTASSVNVLQAMTKPNAIVGGFPEVVPGADNYLTLIQGINRADLPSWTTDLVLSYHPRWLWVGA